MSDYFSLVGMNHNQSLQNKNNRITEQQALRVVYRDKKSTFEDLLEKDKSVPAHFKS